MSKHHTKIKIIRNFLIMIYVYFTKPKLLKTDVIKSYYYIKTFGLKSLIVKLKQKVFQRSEFNDVDALYQLWIKNTEPIQQELLKQKEVIFKYQPRISIITPTFNTQRDMLIEMLLSVMTQTYSNWELCIADGASTLPHVKEILEYAKKDGRIKVKYLDKNKGISENSNEAISLATGECIALLDHDDTLATFALFEVVKAINKNKNVEFIYSDEDKISEDGAQRYCPFFKPDFAPDGLRSHNYIGHLVVIKKSLQELIGGWFRPEFEGNQNYDLILRITENTKNIAHIPKILYHQRAHNESSIDDMLAKSSVIEAGRKALQEHLERIGSKGEILIDKLFYMATYDISENPLVSIIIPNKNHGEILKKCVMSILQKSSYKNFEILIIENSSSEKEVFEIYDELKQYKNVRILAIENEEKFNYSRINNRAVRYVNGDLILFLNNDTEVINEDWLERMIEHAIRKDVGAVGAKLYYPNGTIQHAGVIVGLGGIAGHANCDISRNDSGYFNNLRLIQNYSAVTAACLMMRKDVFNEVGGFDEKLTLAYNDVDLCLLIRKRGYLIVWTPYAELYHYESKTRGIDDTPEKINRFRQEIIIMRDKWGSFLENGDPYFNCNLSLSHSNFLPEPDCLRRKNWINRK